MSWIFPQQADDLLDVDSLPPTDNTELNYRTRPITADQERRLTMLMFLVPLPVIVLLSATFDFLMSLHPWLNLLAIAVATLLFGWITVREWAGAVMRPALIGGALFAIAGVGGNVWALLRQIDDGTVRWLALIMTWVACCLIARQAAAWILAGPTVDRERMDRWRVNLPQIIPRGLSLDCPELLTFSVGLVLIGPAVWLAAWGAMQLTGQTWYWPLLLVVTIPSVWVGWHILAFAFVPSPDVHHSLWMTWKAIVLFVSYDIYHTPAAGVFRFPARWLRPPMHRWLFLSGVLTLIGFSVGACCPDPIEVYRHGGSLLAQLLINLGVISLSGPLLLFGFLWLIAGTLLARFDAELSHHRDEDTTDWDNYVDRIINSNDALERKHFLRGTSETGDYPILVHEEIQDMHEHVTGDTGASKTSLGISPLATQLIARAESSVVIIDLKGDQALFETCRREAARTRKLRFRWLTNEVGKTTFGFNPFLQSHNTKMTREQLTQELLQGMSLDYGIRYGAGYFTAMNEIVMNNVVKATGAASFRELSSWLSNREWYKTIGHQEDWKQARHLSALVTRLAASDAINVVPGMFPNQPEVLNEAIDVGSLFEEPQVVYLSLRSAVEPTNAPAIARLFLWAAFAAASHRQKTDRRVYFFIDEVQQVISDGMKLIFEQFRDLGGTIIAAHQTAGQLNRDGTDLSDTIDSCTAVKQVFRASDLRSLERLEKLAGKRWEKVPMWMQSYERGTGDLVERYDPVLSQEGLVRVTEKERSRLSSDELLAIGARRQSSLIRFTFGSGYTQFAGATVPMVSQFSISEQEYERRRDPSWPTAPGAFVVGSPDAGEGPTGPTGKAAPSGPPPEGPDSSDGYLEDFERRGGDAIPVM